MEMFFGGGERKRLKVENTKLCATCHEVENEINATKLVNAVLLKNLEDSRMEESRLKRYVGLKQGQIQRLFNNMIGGVQSNFPNFFLHLPEEIVEIIVEYLTERKDRHNACKSNRVFDKLLGPSKVMWLFEDVFPFLAEALPLFNIIQLRQVCKGWKNCVDGLLESKPWLEMTFNNNKYLSRQHSLEIKFNLNRYFTTTQSVAKFSEDMAQLDINHNPFVGRRVSFFNRGEDQDFWAILVPRLLAQFGHHVWDCGIILSQPGWISTLHDCLHKLPNLKRLFLVVNTEAQQEDLEDRAFPDLPQLAAIDVIGGLSSFFNYMLPKYCHQLKDLSIRGIGLPSQEPLVLGANMLPRSTLESGFPCLTFLTVSFEQQHLKELPKLTMLKCPLKNLIIGVSHAVLKLERILDVFLNFRETLQHVELHFDKVFENDDEEVEVENEIEGVDLDFSPPPVLQTCYLLNACSNFPQLKTLHLGNVVYSLNFLTLLPSLTCLEILVSNTHVMELFRKMRAGEVIKIHGYVDSMYESNIWRVMPSLLRFRITERKLMAVPVVMAEAGDEGVEGSGDEATGEDEEGNEEREEGSGEEGNAEEDESLTLSFRKVTVYAYSRERYEYELEQRNTPIL